MTKNKNFISKQKLFIIMIVGTIFLMLLIEASIISYFKMNKLLSSSYFDNNKTVINQCELEWEKLNENVYFRKNLAFYYSDINKIHIYLERNNKIQYKYKLLIKIIWKKYEINHFANTVNSYTWRTDDQYSFEYIESDFNIKQLNLSIDLNDKFNLEVKVEVLDNPSISTNKLISLIIKNFNTNNNDKKHSVLCGKTYYYENSHLNYYEWWLNINKINGYDKIVLFNNSYGNGSWSQFNDIFKKHQDLVQVVQFQCLPNFFDLKNKNKSYINFFEIFPLYGKYPLPYHQHFEFASFNECLLTNRDKYKYVTIMDDDETIMPRKEYNNEIIESLYQNYEPYSEKIDPITNRSTKFIPYFENLLSKFNLGSKATFGFRWAPYMKNKHIKLIFNEIEKIYLSNITDHLLKIQDENDTFGLLSFRLRINGEQDFKYAKYLYEMHLKYIEPFFKNNSQILNSVPEPYTRFYYFNGKETVFHSWYFKHIHDASEAFKVSTHLPENRVSSSLNVPVNLGHVTHFREDYREAYQWKQKEIPIKELFFDFVYFNNYFKPILKIVSFK